jgi:hypothetical protein
MEWYLMMGASVTKIDKISLHVVAILVCLMKMGNVLVNNNYYFFQNVTKNVKSA